MNHPIVFIHGSGDSARIWRLQQEYLAARHVASYAIDLPGHGERPDTLPPEVSVLDYAHAAHNIIQHELRLNQPIIAGHSLGGAIALSMALEYGPELGGLILIGTGSRLRVHSSFLESARTTHEQARLELAETAIAPANVALVMQPILNEQVPAGPNILYRDLSACNVFDCMARLHEIMLPSLIICGADDVMTPVKYSQYLQQQLPGSTLCVIPNAGHYVMREQAEAVNNAIENWLKQG